MSRWIAISLILVLKTSCNADNQDVSTNSVGEKGKVHRIVGGSSAFLGEFPWQGVLYRGGSATCGCSLLDSCWVITAAHCTYEVQPQNLRVKFGIVVQTVVVPTYEITAIFNHGHFNRLTLQNDISLLRIQGQVEFITNQISPIPLPVQNYEPPVGEECKISGWGVTDEVGSSLSTVLQKATVPVVSQTDCENWYKTEGITIISTQLCAGYEAGGVDTCQGDSGGPLVCPSNGYVLQGITSFGIGCARAERPGVYTRVSHYVDWINLIRRINSGSSSYRYCQLHLLYLLTLMVSVFLHQL